MYCLSAFRIQSIQCTMHGPCSKWMCKSWEKTHVSLFGSYEKCNRLACKPLYRNIEFKSFSTSPEMCFLCGQPFCSRENCRSISNFDCPQFAFLISFSSSFLPKLFFLGISSSSAGDYLCIKFTLSSFVAGTRRQCIFVAKKIRALLNY